MKTEMNLLPSEFQRSHKKKKINYLIFLPIVLFIIIFFVGDYYITQKIETYEKEIQKLRTKLDKINKEYSKKKDKKGKVKELKNKVTEKKEQFKLIKGLLKKKSDIAEYFRKISLLIPDRVWLDSLEYERDKSNFLMVGKAFSHGLIKRFVNNLQDSPSFTETFLLQANAIEKKNNYLVQFKLKTKLKGR